MPSSFLLSLHLSLRMTLGNASHPLFTHTQFTHTQFTPFLVSCIPVDFCFSCVVTNVPQMSLHRDIEFFSFLSPIVYKGVGGEGLRFLCWWGRCLSEWVLKAGKEATELWYPFTIGQHLRDNLSQLIKIFKFAKFIKTFLLRYDCIHTKSIAQVCRYSLCYDTRYDSYFPSAATEMQPIND